jgi:hypothetical protein
MKMKKTNQKKAWDLAAIFIIVLIVSLPIYSANVYALGTVQISKNEGEKGFWGFLDAEGDVWTVEALITNIANGSVDPSQVKIKIGDNEVEFGSCTDSTLGVSCEYISPLTDGVKESEYTFQVVFYEEDELGYVVANPPSNGDVIKSDGSAPTITDLSISQNKIELGVDIGFTVNDKKEGAPSIGIKLIEIIDADTGNVLQTIGEFEVDDVETYDYLNDGDFGGKLQAEFDGEGWKHVKIKAEDHFGHITTSPVISFEGDFVKPEIIENSLKFVDFGKFIGEYVAKSDISVLVKETNDFIVQAYADQVELDGEEADCDPVLDEEDVWECTWDNVEANPESSLDILVVATDESGNVNEKKFTTDFTKDNSPPVIEFFGSERFFDGKSYIKSKSQRIVLIAREQGAGLNSTGVRANLIALGGLTSQSPKDECMYSGDEVLCYWDTTQGFSSAGVAKVNMETLRDNVGNDAEMPTSELIVDTSGPRVDKLEVYGNSEVGDKTYFQSNDQIKISLEAFEVSGLVVMVNLDGIVNDAENVLFENDTIYTRGLGDGWQTFTEDDCVRGKEGRWVCEFLTKPIKSGYQSSVKMEIKVQDTAGNDAESWPESDKVKNAVFREETKHGMLTFELLALSSEDNPDYWEMATAPVALLRFVDLDAAKTIYTKAPFRVTLSSDNIKARALSFEMVGCEATDVSMYKNRVGTDDIAVSASSAPEIRRAILYGTNFIDGGDSPITTNIIFEFSPFEPKSRLGISDEDFKEAIAEYVCQIKIFSKVGKDAIDAAEFQEVRVPVAFSYSELGAADEAIADKVKEIRESGFMKFANVVNWIKVIIDWINYILKILQIFTKLVDIYDIFDGALVSTATKVEGTLVGGGLGTALRGGCVTMDQNSRSLTKFMSYINIPVEILNCNPNPGKTSTDEGLDLGFYGWWQKSILEFYNAFSLRGPMGIPAQSLYENMYLSALGLCVPGIIYNIDKAREIQCRKMICYGKEVPSGIATMESCEDLYDLQMCEFYYGPMFDFVGFGAITYLGKMIKSAISSPLGLISLTEVFACGLVCAYPDETGGAMKACKLFTIIDKILGVVDSILGAIDNRPDVQGSPYCKIAEDIDVDELAGGTDDDEEAAEAEYTLGTETADGVEQPIITTPETETTAQPLISTPETETTAQPLVSTPETENTGSAIVDTSGLQGAIP